jgi:hypothetical protein
VSKLPRTTQPQIRGFEVVSRPSPRVVPGSEDHDASID